MTALAPGMRLLDVGAGVGGPAAWAAERLAGPANPDRADAGQIAGRLIHAVSRPAVHPLEET